MFSLLFRRKSIRNSSDCPAKYFPRLPPAACRLVRGADSGAHQAALTITSPLDHAEYVLDRHDRQQMLLSCAAGSEVRQVFWYVNDRFLRAASATERVFFRLPGGAAKISCADDHGRNADINLQVNEL